MAKREALRVQILALPGIQYPLSVDEFIESLADSFNHLAPSED
jgi:hypothetical protein